jgi:serine O-acetyltransferase
MLPDIRRDYASYYSDKPSLPKIILGFFRIPGLRASVLYRLGHRHWIKRHRFRAALFTRAIRAWCQMDIELGAAIGPGVCFPHTWGIVIGGTCTIGEDCRIMQGVTIGGSGGRRKLGGQSQPFVGNNVLVGAGAKVLGPVNIGNGVKIGANSVVIRDIAPGVSVFGVPARNVISFDFDSESIF